MSRAFVKDDDDRPERPMPRIAGSRHPNRITPLGLARLRAALDAARESDDLREADYLHARIAAAQIVDAPPPDANTIAFGATVALRQPDGSSITVRIVGEDEADPRTGAISWTSPYALALEGHRAGDRVAVRRPAGTAVVTVESISYD